MTALESPRREIDRLQEENRQLRADLADERARAVALAEAHVEIKRDLEARCDALRAERYDRETDVDDVACDLTACDLGRILLWAASVAIERDELRAKAEP